MAISTRTLHAIEDFYAEQRRANLAQQQAAGRAERNRDLARSYQESLQDAQGCSDLPDVLEGE